MLQIIRREKDSEYHSNYHDYYAILFKVIKLYILYMAIVF